MSAKQKLELTWIGKDKSPSPRPSPKGRGGKMRGTMSDLFGDGEGEA